MAIRICKGNANGVELSGLKLDEDKKRNEDIAGRVGKRKAGSTNFEDE